VHAAGRRSGRHAFAGILGWDVRPLLAGAGLLGVALGFGAQTLVRDWIAGIFILAEDQFSVGDLIEINGKAATVEMLGLRATRLRDFNGNLHFVPNGEMKIGHQSQPRLEPSRGGRADPRRSQSRPRAGGLP
jgi:small conductance mechanosensitive channel